VSSDWASVQLARDYRVDSVNAYFLLRRGTHGWRAGDQFSESKRDFV
jgi:hypothetical protein